MLKRIAQFLLLIGVVLLFSQNYATNAVQSIRLPLAPRYTYNPNTNTFSEYRYGISNACENTQLHVNNARYAVDFAGGLNTGTPIYAPVSGTVTYAEYGNSQDGTSGYGLLLVLSEDGADRQHWLAHLSKFYITSGHVNQGDLIALSGDTGNGPAHLHYHVQTSGGSPVDVRDELPGINWFDSNDYCIEGAAYDGNVQPARIPNGVTNNNNCAEFYNSGVTPGVYGFDAPNCQGHIIFGPYGQGNYNLANNDRLRSVSTPGNLHFWLYAHVDDDSLKHCHERDMWNLDTDPYNFSTTHIGWDSSYQPTYPGGIDVVSSGYNLVSKVVVTTDACPTDQGSRVSAVDISYGYGIGGGSGDPTVPSWLLEFSKTDVSLFGIQIHTLVDASQDYSAHRVLVDGQNIGETGASEQFVNWNSFGWADGYHTLRVEYRRVSDNGNWANALSYEEQFYLSPNRNGAAPCDGRDGAQLSAGGGCVILTQSFAELAQIGWGDIGDLSITVRGNYEAWAYYGADYQGPPKVIRNGETLSVGGNVSSIELRPPAPQTPPLPQYQFAQDANTVHLYHFDEGSGATLTDSLGTLNGSINASNWVTGRFGQALFFPNATDGAGVTFGMMDVCPLTAELWVSQPHGRLIGQLGDGGSSGPLKWLLYMELNRPKFEIWSAGGSQNTTSYISIDDSNWHYIMATYDCGSRHAMLYVDNVLAGEFDSAATWNGGAATVGIGAVENIGKCNCAIDEVRISNVVRVPTEQPAPPSPPTLNLTYTVSNHDFNHVEAQATWSNAAEDWQVLDWGDGATVGYFGGSGTSVGHQNGNSHDYAVGTYTMVFTVKGLDGQNYTASQVIDVQVPPEPSRSLTVNVVEPVHGAIETNATWSGASEDWQVLNWGDGTETGYFGASGTNVGNPNGNTHTYVGPGTYTLTLHVRGMEGADYTATQQVVINPPSYSLTATVTNQTTGLVETNASWSNAENAWQVLSWGDSTETGYFGSQGTNVGHENGNTHNYAPGTYTLTFTVIGGYGQQYQTTQQVTINAPTPPNVTLAYTQGTGETFNYVEVQATWSNAAEDWQVVDFGDGASVGYFGGSGTSVGHPNGNSHWYAVGNYTITFTVKGLDGQDHTATQQITVAVPTPTPTPVPPPPTYSLTILSVDNQTGLVQYRVQWSNALNDWQHLDFGHDGAYVDYQGGSGDITDSHVFNPGTYTMTFTVKGLDSNNYPTTQQVTVGS